MTPLSSPYRCCTSMDFDCACETLGLISTNSQYKCCCRYFLILDCLLLDSDKYEIEYTVEDQLVTINMLQTDTNVILIYKYTLNQLYLLGANIFEYQQKDITRKDIVNWFIPKLRVALKFAQKIINSENERDKEYAEKIFAKYLTIDGENVYFDRSLIDLF